MTIDEAAALTPLVGQECDQIHFYRDKTVIGFSQWDWWLSCTSSPVVHHAGAVSRLPELGSHDAICSLINTVAEAASVDKNGNADVRFSNGAHLILERGWQLERWWTERDADQ